jgi:hypothetical protein
MESRIERTQQFLDANVTDHDFQDQLMKIEADMIEGLQESITLGWLTPEQADQMIADWHERYGHAQ